MDEEIGGAAFVFDGHSIRPALSSKLWKFEGGVSVTEAGGDPVGGGEGPLAKQLQKKNERKCLELYIIMNNQQMERQSSPKESKLFNPLFHLYCSIGPSP